MALRYQRQKLLTDHAGVKTYEGIDPLTGLPVLIYVFKGKPHLLLTEMESENIPGVLASQNEGQLNYVVVAYVKGYKIAKAPLEMGRLEFLIDSVRALKDAAEIGVLHGDIRPERFWLSSDHVLIEGFGLPWVTELSPYSPPEKLSSFAGDVYSWAKSALELADPPQVARQLLESCLIPQPNLRPSAEQLYEALLRIKTKSSTVGSIQPSIQPAKVQAVGNPILLPKTLEIDFNVSDDESQTTLQSTLDAPLLFQTNAAQPTPAAQSTPTQSRPVQPTMQGMPKPPSSQNTLVDFSDLSDLDIQVPGTPGTMPSPPPVTKQFPKSFDREAADPMVLQSDPGLREPPKVSQVPLEDRGNTKPKKTPDTKPFVKDLPPGATYRAGKSENVTNVPYKDTPPPISASFNDVFLKNDSSNHNTRRTLMLVGLGLAGLVLAALVFFNQPGNPLVTTSTNSTLNYIVNVTVEPNIPVQLRIISSPAGSKKTVGSILNTVPNQIVLDQAGAWQFQGELQDLKSEVVSLLLPDQRSITIIMPPLPVTPTEEEPTTVEPQTP